MPFSMRFILEFCDSNNDGVGDLNGIASKLDYLKELGVDAIWISPCFPSPQVDFGYDVSDYENIDPMYGTWPTSIISRVKPRGEISTSSSTSWSTTPRISTSGFSIRNHRAPPLSRLVYLARWKGPGSLPTIGFRPLAVRRGSWIPPRSVLLPLFLSRAARLELAQSRGEGRHVRCDRWWYNRGVAGFRLDAVDTLFEDPNLQDNPIAHPGKNAFGDPFEQNKYNTKLPEVHDILRGLRQVADEHNAVLIGETWTADVAELNQYYGKGNNELQLPMDFFLPWSTSFRRLNSANRLPK